MNKHITLSGYKSAVLEHGVMTVDFNTVREAKNAFDALPDDRKEIARITINSKVFCATEIANFRLVD